MRLDRIRPATMAKYLKAAKLHKHGDCSPAVASQRAGLSLHWFNKIKKVVTQAENDQAG